MGEDELIGAELAQQVQRIDRPALAGLQHVAGIAAFGHRPAKPGNATTGTGIRQGGDALLFESGTTNSKQRLHNGWVTVLNY